MTRRREQNARLSAPIDAMAPAYEDEQAPMPIPVNDEGLRAARARYDRALMAWRSAFDEEARRRVRAEEAVSSHRASVLATARRLDEVARAEREIAGIERLRTRQAATEEGSS